MNPIDKSYAIYNPKTGLWSAGGMGPAWRKTPKCWSPGPFKNHLRQFVRTQYLGPYRPNHMWPVKDLERVIIIYDSYAGCEVYDMLTQDKSEFDILTYLVQCALDECNEPYTRKNKRAIDNQMDGSFIVFEPDPPVTLAH